MILKVYPFGKDPDIWEDGTFDAWGIADDNKVFIVKDKNGLGFITSNKLKNYRCGGN